MKNNSDVLIKLDIDGVLRNFDKAVNDFFHIDHPELSNIYPAKYWSMTENYPTYPDINNYFKIVRAHDIYTQAELFPGAAEFFTRVVNTFENVWLVTTQFEHTMYPTVLWCNKNLPGINNVPMVFSHDKGLIGKDKFKHRILIDDAPHGCLSEQKHGGIPVCFGQLYNNTLPTEMIRISAENNNTVVQFEQVFNKLIELIADDFSG